MTNDQKTCFIIMPITTPEPMLGEYRDGAYHFNHVLDCLFVPSVEKAKYKPIRPKAKGSDLIHAEIVSNLEKADLVLCDMSCLNPNVFFEFGIRTSLNKPVCVVKDKLTEKVPFDAGIINHQEYNCSLDPWVLNSEISKLAQHLTDSAKHSNGQNMLWKYFGLKSTSKSYEGKGDVETKLDMLALQVESVSRKLEERDSPGVVNEAEDARRDRFGSAARFAHRRVGEVTDTEPTIIILRAKNRITIKTQTRLSPDFKEQLSVALQKRYRVNVEFSEILDEASPSPSASSSSSSSFSG